MIYPTVALKCPKDVDDMIKVIDIALRPLNIHDIPMQMTNFWVDGCNQRCNISIIPEGIPFLEYQEFIKVYCDFKQSLNDFINSLQADSQVVIESRRGEDYYYPYSFCEEMLQFCGQTVTIKSINKGCSGNDCRFYNGDDHTYGIVEDHGQFIWHSSMFELIPVNIKKLQLSNIDFNITSLIKN